MERSVTNVRNMCQGIRLAGEPNPPSDATELREPHVSLRRRCGIDDALDDRVDPVSPDQEVAQNTAAIGEYSGDPPIGLDPCVVQPAVEFDLDSAPDGLVESSSVAAMS
jgi:hypothetical protein